MARRLQGCASRIIKRPCLSRLRFGTCAALALCVLLVAFFPVAAFAQQAARSFEELQARVKIGDIVFVVDDSGLETRGKVERVSDVSMWLTVDGIRRGFDENSIARIDLRRRDSVRNGLAIGLGSGALLGFLAGRAADSPTCPRSGIECGQGALLGTVGGAVLGAVGGWLIDALTRNREVIYLAPTPQWSPHCEGPLPWSAVLKNVLPAQRTPH